MPKTRRVLASSKCHQCRMDKQKCLPVRRTWPGPRCDRCERFDYACSANRSRRREKGLDNEDNQSTTAVDDVSESNHAETISETPAPPIVDKYVGPARQIYRQLANIDLILDTIARSKTVANPPNWGKIFNWNKLEAWLESERQLCKQRAASEAQKALEIPDRDAYQDIISNTFYETPKMAASDVKQHFASCYIQLTELQRHSDKGRNHTTAIYLGEQLANTIPTIELDWKAQVLPLIDTYTKTATEISQMGQQMSQIASFAILWRALEIYNSHLHSSVYTSQISNLSHNPEAQRVLLFRAAQTGSRIMLELFSCSDEMDICVLDNLGRTVLHYACWQSDAFLLSFLLSIPLDHLLSLEDSHGDTVFHHAARSGSLECLKTLLLTDAKALINEPNKNGATAFDVALLNKKRTCYRLLAEAGATDRFGNPKEGGERFEDMLFFAEEGQPDYLLPGLERRVVDILPKPAAGATG